MPELPEVQTVVNDLKNCGLLGRKICSVQVHWARTVNTHNPDDFIEQLRGLSFVDIRRRAKYIIFDLSEDKVLVVHLRMTGQFSMNSKVPQCKHTHVILQLNDGQFLCYKDTRKFGRWSLLDASHQLFAELGPEPLDDSISEARFYQMCQSKQRQLKPLLLDQTFIAGLGNIYVDEALFDSGLHPLNLANGLSRKKSDQLLCSIRKVLKVGLSNMGTTLGSGMANFYSVSHRKGRNQDQLMVFRRTGEACFVCETPIQRLIVGQRSTHICPKCQKSKK